MIKRIVGGGWMAVVALAIMLVAQAAWAKNPKNPDVYVIGDSLSDPGNLYDLTGFYPFSPPYDERFSNGPVWAEYLADDLGTKMENRAYGGAFTDVLYLPNPLRPQLQTPFSNYVSYGFYPFLRHLPGIPQEVADLIRSHPKRLDPNALYIIWAGANDFFAAIDVLEIDFDLAKSIVKEAPTNVVNAVCKLSRAGAKHFAVANLPDLGLTPFGAPYPETLKLLTVQFNEALADGLEKSRCPETLVILDVYAFLNDVVANPAAYGFTNVTDECITLGPMADCDTYLFWDDVHPTTHGHSLISDSFLNQLCEAGSFIECL
jgi:phospholipase/lecithinase/hemolysin